MMANSFHLTSKEDREVDVGDGGSDEHVEEQTTFDLVGRVVAEKSFSGHTLKSNIGRLLHPVMGLQFPSFGDNHILLQFNHPLDRTHAMKGSPWLIDRCAMLLSKISPDANMETMPLNMMSIVVRLSNIPFGHRNPAVARSLCASLGVVDEVIPPKGDGPQSYVRVRVQINITEPIPRGVYLRIGSGSRHWVSFTYERMPVYCYLCGLGGHLERSAQPVLGRISWIPENLSRMENG